MRVSALIPATTAARATLALVAASVVAAVVAGAGVFLLTNALLTRQSSAVIAADVASLKERLASSGTGGLAALVGERSRIKGTHLYLLLDAGGKRVAGNLETRPAELAPEGRGVFTYPGADGPRLAAGVALPVPGGGSLIVGQDIEAHRELIRHVNWALLVGAGLMAVAGVLAGLFVNRRILSRVEAAVGASQAVMAGDLSRRLPVSGSGDELDRLARAVNAMLERIGDLMLGMREISDNIAHDLKTPLARLRARAEAALADAPGEARAREALAHVIEEADGLIRTFNALLLIARLEAGAVRETLTSVDVAAVARDVAELYAPLAEEAGLRLETEAEGRVMVEANRELIGQAIANLVDNAIKYSRPADGHPGTDVPRDVRLAVASDGAGARVTVGDRGPGIAPGDRERALKRFVRLESSRSRPGTGLGLSLVAAVARLHNGTIRLDDNRPGLRVELTLPLPGRRVPAA